MQGIRYYYLLVRHYTTALPVDILHSPFVFSLYNNCMKQNALRNRFATKVYPKWFQVIAASIRYFNYTIGYAFGFDKEEMQQLHPNGKISDGKQINHTDDSFVNYLDYLIIRCSQNITDPYPLFKQYLSSMKNESMVAISGIYNTRKTKNGWNQIKEIAEVKVTVDLFFVGLVFFRKEQRKQHFALRLF